MPTGVTKSDYTLKCRAEIEQIRILHKEFVSKTELSDMTVMAEILRQTRPDTVLQLANSTSVRWMQLFETRADLTYYCNRGTSGIDGSLSTAAGFAYNSARNVLFVTGDVSFIYDSNGLWNNYTGKNLKIIVLNNNGGNIFRFIGDKELMKNNLHFFTTPHQVQIKLLVEAYGVDYLNCNESADLSGKIEQLLNSANATVLEVFTDSELNTENYKKYFQHIKE
jgi:2-succinyl-5-enolpyruvyl-6-hydroxy-3-cyclohexene-1-carboxylate synthase